MSDSLLRQALTMLIKNNLEWKEIADSGDCGSWKAEDLELYMENKDCIQDITDALNIPADQFAGAGKAIAGAADKDEQRLTLINSLRASKGWTTDYATAYVEDHFAGAGKSIDKSIVQLVPDGMVLVPRKPTQEMLDAAYGVDGQSDSISETIWGTMIDASQST